VVFLPRLPPTRSWAVEDLAHDARPQAAASGGRSRGGGDRGGDHSGDRGGGGGCSDFCGGGANAPSIWRHVQLPPSDTQPPLP